MYYLSTGLIKAYVRVVLLVGFASISFFYPAQCTFPDGYECWDTGHIAFAAFVMERVEQDRRQGAQPAPGSCCDSGSSSRELKVLV